jgi:hypothetical protein
LLIALSNLNIHEPLLKRTLEILTSEGIDLDLIRNGMVSDNDLASLKIGLGVRRKLLSLTKTSKKTQVDICFNF